MSAFISSKKVSCKGHSGEWQRCVFFKNTATGEIVSMSPSWEEYFDDVAQAKYWYNSKTGEATWVNPMEGGRKRTKKRKTPRKRSVKKRKSTPKTKTTRV